MGIPVKLEVFEGPLDLLLHLIEKNKVDIYDIPIVEITNQYMEYIRQMQREDLNVMSEFLVMAATLLDIKCKMLLPKEVKEDGEEEDPRQELVEQLLQYKMYKYMSYELRDRQVDADLILYKNPTIPEEVLEYVEPVDLDLLLGDLTMVQLKKVFQEVPPKRCPCIPAYLFRQDALPSMFRRRISLAVANSSPMNPSLSIQHRIAYFSLSVCWGFGLAVLTILASWLIARQSWI